MEAPIGAFHPQHIPCPQAHLTLCLHTYAADEMIKQVFWLLFPYLLFSLAFGGAMVPRMNLYVEAQPSTIHLVATDTD
jgi:hypothetical protein